MSVQTALNTGLFSKLSGGTALVNALGGTAIYYAQAPDNVAYPYVVFSYQAGGPQNVTPSDMRDAVVYVRCYATAAAQGGTIDALVSSLLHGGSISVSGYTNYWTKREQDIALVETDAAGRIVYTSGGLYRIRIDS